MRGSILLSEPSLTAGTRRTHVEGVVGNMKDYATGNIHRGYMQFTGRALVTLGLTAAVVGAQWEHDWLEQVAEAHDDTADLPAAASPAPRRARRPVHLTGRAVG